MFIELGPVQARVFATAIHFYPSLIFLGKAAAYQNGAPYRLLALPTNIRLRMKRMAEANTLSYCDKATIRAVKSFIV